MSTWKHLIRFVATDGQVYTALFLDLEDAVAPAVKEESELVGSTITGFASFADLLKGNSGKPVVVQKVCRRLC